MELGVGHSGPVKELYHICWRFSVATLIALHSVNIYQTQKQTTKGNLLLFRIEVGACGIDYSTVRDDAFKHHLTSKT